MALKGGIKMQDIPKVRFEALAAYCRRPETPFYAEEIRWLQIEEEQLIIVLIRDTTDSDFAAILLSRDLKERYRFVAITAFFSTPEEALTSVEIKAKELLVTLENARVQGDEKGKSIDFFTPISAPNKLNKEFVTLTTHEGYSPAMEIIKPMMRWHEDADGNFVEQFQTTGFDARIWELYLFAMLTEVGYISDKTVAIPDFCAKGLEGEFCIEATTVNPTRDKNGDVIPPPSLNTPEQFAEFRCEYMPIKFAGPLTAKLAKKYWERPEVENRPLVFAIQDFHAPMSMTMTNSSLQIYLYGCVHDWHHMEDGELVITPKKVDQHKWGSKIVPSGFFNLPDAENVSAVIMNSGATLAKFNRMGLISGFGSQRVKMIREGLSSNPDPNASLPKKFVMDVNSADYSETWMEGMDVYHNPNAKHSLPIDMLPGAAHHRMLNNGLIESLIPDWHPLSSITKITIM